MGFFLPFVYSLLFTTLLFSKPSVQIRFRNESQTCPNPVTPITVINFEYTEGQTGPVYNHHGIEWSGWDVGFKRYPGYPTGLSPIPSNYTTLAANSTGNGTKILEFGNLSPIGGFIQGAHSVSLYFLIT